MEIQFLENMVVSNTNSQPMGNLYEDQFNDYTVSNWGNLSISSVFQNLIFLKQLVKN